MKEITAKEMIPAAAVSCAAAITGAYLTGSDAFSLHHHSALKNILFSNITFMGDTIFAFAVAGVFIFFFNKKDEGIKLLFTILATLFITQVIKNIYSGGIQLYFENNAYYFENAADIPVNIISSHTAVAFTLAAFFASLTKNKITGILIFAAAALIACTRIYTANESILSLLAGLIPAGLAVFFTETVLKNKRNISRPKNKRHRNSTGESLSWY